MLRKAAETSVVPALWKTKRIGAVKTSYYLMVSRKRTVWRWSVVVLGGSLSAGLFVAACVTRVADLARARMPHLAQGSQAWWDEPVKFFDVARPRLWVFWRRILHSAHHRTQLTVYLRLLDRPVPPIYGPTAEVTWSGAAPTRTVDAVRRS